MSNRAEDIKRALTAQILQEFEKAKRAGTSFFCFAKDTHEADDFRQALALKHLESLDRSQRINFRRSRRWIQVDAIRLNSRRRRREQLVAKRESCERSPLHDLEVQETVEIVQSYADTEADLGALAVLKGEYTVAQMAKIRSVSQGAIRQSVKRFRDKVLDRLPA